MRGAVPRWEGDEGHRHDYLTGMSLPPDQPPPSPPAKPKLSAEERRTRQADRLKTIRLRMTIDRELENRSIIILLHELGKNPAKSATCGNCSTRGEDGLAL